MSSPNLCSLEWKRLLGSYHSSENACFDIFPHALFHHGCRFRCRCGNFDRSDACSGAGGLVYHG